MLWNCFRNFGFSDQILGNPKKTLGISKARLGISKTFRGISKTILGIFKTLIEHSKTRLGNSTIRNFYSFCLKPHGCPSNLVAKPVCPDPGATNT